MNLSLIVLPLVDCNKMPNHHKRHHLKPAEWLAFALLAVTGGALVITMIQNTPVLPHIKHIGCFKSDASFSQDKVLGFNAADSSTVGANLALAFEQAKSVWREGGGAVAMEEANLRTCSTHPCNRAQCRASATLQLHARVRTRGMPSHLTG